MPIELPILSPSGCDRVVACGQVNTDEESITELLKERKRLIAGFTKGGLKYFVLLMSGGSKNRHFHLEIALSTFFSAKGQPKPNSKISEIQEIADTMLGAEIDLNFKCEFPTKFKDIPESGLIKTLSFDSKVAGIGVKLTKGTLSLSGSQISEISWSLQPNGENVNIALGSDFTTVITSGYLVDGHKLLHQYFRTLVLDPSTSQTT